MKHPFVHLELATTSLPKAKAFYRDLFKWKLKDQKVRKDFPYTFVDTGKEPGGGMMKQCVPGAPSAWMPYVLVKNIEKATQKAKRLGAEVLKDVTEVKGYGWFSIVADPAGAAVGLWQPKT